ncbi:hypothetical protein [Corynebacterium crudilactis]|uniref:Secreted protein n=1 Tax=Corynebacterium crudilactis TaxID=1652495 RepID=A0A172QTZ5_9CORY|nr:hypothetical protein [Corynebacterium crudilactis]ANE04177.1 hypothetical protein ccrud_08155 [Corynebacterium crudilactis]
MSSLLRRFTITAVTVVMASTAIFTSTASASAKCVDPNKQQIGPLLVQASSANTSRIDVCSQIKLGTFWEGINGQSGKFGLLNIKYADNKYFVLHMEDVTGLGLGSSDQNPAGTFG